MIAEQRAALALEAAAQADGSRHGGAPGLTADSTADDIAAWLQWCDPNGCHTRELAEGEGYDFYTLDEAWDALNEMLEGAR